MTQRGTFIDSSRQNIVYRKSADMSDGITSFEVLMEPESSSDFKIQISLQ